VSLHRPTSQVCNTTVTKLAKRQSQINQRSQTYTTRTLTSHSSLLTQTIQILSRVICKRRMRTVQTLQVLQHRQRFKSLLSNASAVGECEVLQTTLQRFCAKFGAQTCSRLQPDHRLNERSPENEITIDESIATSPSLLLNERLLPNASKCRANNLKMSVLGAISNANIDRNNSTARCGGAVVRISNNCSRPSLSSTSVTSSA
jgi:hypothetical protein